MLVLLFWFEMPFSGMNAFLGSFMFILRPLIIVLGVLVSIIQAGVFTLLTAIYIAGAVAAHEEH